MWINVINLSHYTWKRYINATGCWTIILWTVLWWFLKEMLKIWTKSPVSMIHLLHSYSASLCVATCMVLLLHNLSCNLRVFYLELLWFCFVLLFVFFADSIFRVFWAAIFDRAVLFCDGSDSHISQLCNRVYRWDRKKRLHMCCKLFQQACQLNLVKGHIWHLTIVL